jgi:hypothetical protein
MYNGYIQMGTRDNGMFEMYWLLLEAQILERDYNYEACILGDFEVKYLAASISFGTQRMGHLAVWTKRA